MITFNLNTNEISCDMPKYTWKKRKFVNVDKDVLEAIGQSVEELRKPDRRIQAIVNALLRWLNKKDWKPLNKDDILNLNLTECERHAREIGHDSIMVLSLAQSKLKGQ